MFFFLSLCLSGLVCPKHLVLIVYDQVDPFFIFGNWLNKLGKFRREVIEHKQQDFLNFGGSVLIQNSDVTPSKNSEKWNVMWSIWAGCLFDGIIIHIALFTLLYSHCFRRPHWVKRPFEVIFCFLGVKWKQVFPYRRLDKGKIL